jgi:hypothetical protein
MKTGLPAPFWVLEGAAAVPISRHALLGGPLPIDWRDRIGAIEK